MKSTLVRPDPRDLDPSLKPRAGGQSRPLLTAALSGLLGLAGGCGEDSEGGKKKPTEQPTDDASTGTVDASIPADASTGAGTLLDGGGVDGGSNLPVVTKETPGERTYASLDADCDALGGYIQVHAACAGSNACKGFSYGDWGDGAVLTEHTCAAMNGCNGLSCVVLPEDAGKSGEEVYAADLAPGGPQSCLNCHAVWEHNSDGDYLPPDATKFKVWVMPGSTRTVDNWLTDVTPESQELIVAMGRANVLPNGTPIVSMMGYHKLFSRTEIEKVVAHVRTLTPVIEQIKVPK